MNETMRILVADDDADIRGLLHDYLGREGFAVFEAADGATAWERFQKERPDAVILDVMMPGLDGMEVIRRIRNISAVPVIFLTGRTDEVDQLLGFGFGADDYVTKPFSPRALAARIKAVLRRSGSGDLVGAGMLTFGELTVDPGGFTVSLSGNPVELTAKEFQLLGYFAARPGKVLTKRQLVTGAWGEEYLGDDSTLMVHLFLREDWVCLPSTDLWYGGLGANAAGISVCCRTQPIPGLPTI